MINSFIEQFLQSDIVFRLYRLQEFLNHSILLQESIRVAVIDYTDNLRIRRERLQITLAHRIHAIPESGRIKFSKMNLGHVMVEWH
jgi:hypothetical protein